MWVVGQGMKMNIDAGHISIFGGVSAEFDDLGT
jgi:hypothetical protein